MRNQASAKASIRHSKSALSHPLPPPRPDFLPTEVLSEIASHLDHPSAVAFALVGRDFFAAAEAAIWRELDISLVPHWGHYPLVYPNVPEGGRAYRDFVTRETDKADKRVAERMRRKVNLITMAGAAKLGAVRVMSIVLQKGVLYHIIHLLDIVSPNLSTLKLCTVMTETQRQERDFELEFDTFDVKLIDSGLHFPSLTHLTLGHGAILFVETFHLLCNVAPNLVCLDICVETELKLQNWEEWLPNIPCLGSDTKLRYLRAALHDFDRASTEDDDYDSAAGHPLIQLIERSPCLERISIPYGQGERYIKDPLMGALSQVPKLEDLYWSGSFRDFDGMEQGGFPSLKRLTVESNHFSMFENLPHLPKLEIIHLLNSHEDRPWTVDEDWLPDTIPIPTLIPKFAAQLRKCPRLKVINDLTGSTVNGDLTSFDLLDRIERRGVFDGRVHSLHHGGEELLLVDFCLRTFERADIVRRPDPADPRDYVYDPTRIGYEDRNGVDREKVFAHSMSPRRMQMLEYDGYAVPMEIWIRMTDLQADPSRAERGMEVGDEAWKILEDWRRSQK